VKKSILLLGAGPMAIEYTKVLRALSVPVITVGRSEASSENYYEQTGVKPILGGFSSYLSNQQHVPDQAIVCVGEKWLGEATRALIKSGVNDILVEKPAGINAADIKEVAALCNTHNSRVHVGYNRRVFSSVEKAQEIIQTDGGLSSFHFEFTEWSHVISELKKEPGVKENWFLANSSHVIDLAFYLGGDPAELQSFSSGFLEWHPSGANFAGAGKTQNGALFTYQANWQAPGRWGVELLTQKHRLYLRPMEKLHIQKIGSVAIEEVPLNDSLDQNFKPGLYRQVESFLSDKKNLPTIEEQVNRLGWYEKINAGI
jgi:predicted dehydrogenase